MAKTTEEVFVSGTFKWAQVFKPDLKVDPPRWSILVYPDAPSLQVINDLKKDGIKNHLKKDDEGYYMRFSRPTYKEFTEEGGIKRRVSFTPPTVVGPDGEPLLDLIGHGSAGTVKLETYKHRTPSGGSARAARLLGVKVTKLNKYEASRDFNEEEKKNTSGFETAKPPVDNAW